MDTKSQSNPGMFHLSPHVLADAIHLPPDTEITSVEWDAACRQIRVFVKAPCFPPTPEGVPLFKSHYIITTEVRPDVVGPTPSYSSKWCV